MTSAAPALSWLIEQDDIELPTGKNLGLWLLQEPSALRDIVNQHQSAQIFCPFYPWAKTITQDFSRELTSGAEDIKNLGGAIVLPSKQKEETLYLIASVINALDEGGLLIAAAENKAGGNRLANMVENFGLNEITSYSKQKCKIICARKTGQLNQEAIKQALINGQKQPILEGAFTSRPGLYGWDKADRASALLCQYLPDDLHGLGADFGCGYGFLTRQILETSPKVKKLCAIDAERRALDLVTENIVGHGARLHPIWDDLTAPHHLPSNLDFVVMNPPFHEGKKADSAIGIKFIESAHKALKKRGRLFMVANAHLPYERSLQDLFFKNKELIRKDGFKVLYAET